MRFISLPAKPLTVGIVKLNFVGEMGPLGSAARMHNPRANIRPLVYRNFKSNNVDEEATAEAFMRDPTSTGCVLFGAKYGRLLPSDSQTWLFPSAGWISISSVNCVRLREAGAKRSMLFRMLSELLNEPSVRNTRFIADEMEPYNLGPWGGRGYMDILSELDWLRDVVAREARNAFVTTQDRLGGKADADAVSSVPFYKLCEWVKNLCGACIFVRYDGRKLTEYHELSHFTQPRDISGVFFMRAHAFRIPLLGSQLLATPKEVAVDTVKDWAVRVLRRDIDEYNAYLASDVYTWFTQVDGEDKVLGTPLFYGSDIRRNGLLCCLDRVIKIMHPSTTVRLRPDIATVKMGEVYASYNAGDS